jgi:hypothetical protein
MESMRYACDRCHFLVQYIPQTMVRLGFVGNCVMGVRWMAVGREGSEG